MSWRFNIGEKVSVITYLNSNGEVELASPSALDSLDHPMIDTFEIIGLQQVTGDLCLLVTPEFDPHSYLCSRVADVHIRSYDIKDRYKGDKCLFIHCKTAYVASDFTPVVQQIHMNGPGGSTCDICHKFIHYASGNLPNGGLACFKCRSTYRWKVDAYLKKMGIDPNLVKF